MSQRIILLPVGDEGRLMALSGTLTLLRARE